MNKEGKEKNKERERGGREGGKKKQLLRREKTTAADGHFDTMIDHVVYSTFNC